MNTPDAYICQYQYSRYSYIPVTVVKKTETTVTVRTADNVQRTFLEERVPEYMKQYPLKPDRRLRERGVKRESYCFAELSYDVATIEKNIKESAIRAALEKRAGAAVDRIQETLRGMRCGDGKYRMNEGEVARLEAVIDVMTGADDVH